MSRQVEDLGSGTQGVPVVERKYQMTRLGTGDYLLPSNDASTLWRISSYVEDGSAEDWNGRAVRGTFWNLWQWDGGFPTPDVLVSALEDEAEFGEWLRWTHWAAGFPTRAAAAKEALRVRP